MMFPHSSYSSRLLGQHRFAPSSHLRMKTTSTLSKNWLMRRHCRHRRQPIAQKCPPIARRLC
jgi:hypothetical protein